MTTEPIIESGMTFGPFKEGHCFYIEKSKIYGSLQQGVKMAEFLLLRFRPNKPTTLWVVEAKSSTPRPLAEREFDAFIEEIRDKLINAFSLGLACCLKRHADTELPQPYGKLNLSTSDFRFVLVINHHKWEWLPPLQEALSKALHAAVKTWAFTTPAVVVMNDHMARDYGLIQDAFFPSRRPLS